MDLAKFITGEDLVLGVRLYKDFLGHWGGLITPA
jgi:hypothetical protein